MSAVQTGGAIHQVLDKYIAGHLDYVQTQRELLALGVEKPAQLIAGLFGDEEEKKDQ